MTYKVFIDGRHGTTGLKIDERLAGRGDVEVLTIPEDKRKDPVVKAEYINAADVVFLCLPDAASKESVALLAPGNTRTRFLDASTAHRTNPDWVYGLPELHGQRDKIRASQRIAVPGCHASAFILAVRPLVDAGLLPREAAVSATSITGYSGGGKSMIAEYEQQPLPAHLQAPRPYGLGLKHKHLPEMMAHTGLAAPPVFMPIVSSFYKGLAVSVPLQLSQLKAGTTPEQIHAALAAHYDGERFIRVMPLRDAATLETGFFDVQACNDTNRVDIFVFASDTQALVIARLDNLGKGASGAAVQSMNVHLGLEESLGLV